MPSKAFDHDFNFTLSVTGPMFVMGETSNDDTIAKQMVHVLKEKFPHLTIREFAGGLSQLYGEFTESFLKDALKQKVSEPL